MVNDFDILFSYLKDVIYHPDAASLDLGQLSSDARKLGEGLLFFGDCIREDRSFTLSIAKGDLSVEPPSSENFLASPIKALQGSLRHLTWQTKQVAKGDYTQRVDFMGDFSDSFNLMIQQLKDRTERLEEEKDTIAKSLELMQSLIYHTHSMIFVFSLEDGKCLFMNHPAMWFKQANPIHTEQLFSRLAEKKLSPDDKSESWDAEILVGESAEEAESFYQIESFCIPWDSEKAIVHIVYDDTERKRHENLIYKLAYTDPLTGLSNRRYAINQMELWAGDGIPFALSFIDLDYLKYCNDTFGHKKGDEYLVAVTQLLKTTGGVVCRVGGDEFLLMHKDLSAEQLDERLTELRKLLQEKLDSEHPSGFSFGSVYVPSNPRLSIDSYIKEADAKMYRYKVEHKRPLIDYR